MSRPVRPVRPRPPPTLATGQAPDWLRQQALQAHLGSISRRLQRGCSIEQINPWAVAYRDELLKVIKQGERGDEALREEVSRYQSVISDLRSRVSALENQFVTRSTRTAQLLQKLQEEETRAEKLQADLDTELERAQVSSEDAGQLRDELEQATQRADEAERRVERRRAEAQDQALKIASLKRELDERTDRVLELSAQLAQAEAGSARADELEERLAEEQQKLTSARDDISKLQRVAEESKDAFQTQVESTARLIADLKEKREDLERELEQLKRLSDEQVEPEQPAVRSAQI